MGIGRKFQDAKNFLEKRYNDEMELDDAVHNALLIMRENFDGEMNEFNIEVAVVGPDRVFRILTPNEVKDYLMNKYKLTHEALVEKQRKGRRECELDRLPISTLRFYSTV